MKRSDVDTFEKLMAQLQGFHSELSMLAKKSPNDALNPFKLKFVNVALNECNSFFGQRYRPFPDFECFPEDQMPSNSGATFIISQYIECAEKFRSDNIVQYGVGWWWSIDGEDYDEHTVRAAPPKKLSK
jgi:hypothetical protein